MTLDQLRLADDPDLIKKKIAVQKFYQGNALFLERLDTYQHHRESYVTSLEDRNGSFAINSKANDDQSIVEALKFVAKDEFGEFRFKISQVSKDLSLLDRKIQTSRGEIQVSEIAKSLVASMLSLRAQLKNGQLNERSLRVFKGTAKAVEQVAQNLLIMVSKIKNPDSDGARAAQELLRIGQSIAQDKVNLVGDMDYYACLLQEFKYIIMGRNDLSTDDIMTIILEENGINIRDFLQAAAQIP